MRFLSNDSFVHLHIHSDYSLVDGIIQIHDLVKQAAQMGCSALALTDQSNLFAMVKFYQAAEALGIKPIIGVEVWVSDSAKDQQVTPLILLCQNEQGYKNLTTLVSRSYTEEKNPSHPRIFKAWLNEYHAGLIAIMPAREDLLLKPLVDAWVSIFPDRFYLEVTRTGLAEDERLIQQAVDLSRTRMIPLVATNNVRFLKREDFEAHEARVCIHGSRLLNDPQRPRQYQEEQYLKTPEQMQSLFADLPEALENSVEIAKRCNFILDLGKIHLPHYPVLPGETLEQVLSQAAHQGLIQRFGDQSIPEAHSQRLNTELAVLNKMGYAGYFLIVADFIRWARKEQIPVGPGRGSGVGSLVAYALGITGLDPLAYDLLFERFLNPERVSMPDFDIDFCIEGRDRVIDYVAQRYGRESVSQIITYGTMAAKAVIRDVGRVLGHPYGFVDKIAKLIPHELGITLDKALQEEPLLKQAYEQEEEVRLLIDLAKKLEGTVRNAGKHAGGVVIAPSKLTDFTPLYCDADGSLLSQFDKNDVETIGLVKFDFLGLRTLTVIDRAIKELNASARIQEKQPIDIDQIPLDDPKVFDFLRTGNTSAIFQLESRGMTDLVKRLKPVHFEEIIALGALFRPGPLQSGMVDDFVNRKHGRAEPEYLHPKLLGILKPTYGVILYQEQVMQIAQVLAGYTLGAADLLRRAMGKKKPEEMAKQRAFFVQGAVDRGVDRAQAMHIFDLIEKFSGYGFNKSHSAAYALITYQCAWLKTYYPEALMAAVLSSEMAHTDKVVDSIQECRKLKITLIPPDVNRSQYAFYVDDQNRIVYGLGAVKGIGEGVVENILKARQQSPGSRSEQPFQDLFDFLSRIDLHKLNIRVLETLIRAGAFDSFGHDRACLVASLPDIVASVAQRNKHDQQGQQDLFGLPMDAQSLILKKDIPPWSEVERLSFEKQSLGFYWSGHPLNQYQDRLNYLRSGVLAEIRPSQGTQTFMGIIVAIKTLVTRKGEKMAFLTLEDESGRQEMVVFADCYQASRELLVKDQFVVVRVEVRLDHASGAYRVRCVALKNLESATREVAKKIQIHLDHKTLDQALIKLLKNIFSEYRDPQGCCVSIVYSQDGQVATLKLGDHWRLNPAEKLLESLKKIKEVRKVTLEF